MDFEFSVCSRNWSTNRARINAEVQAGAHPPRFCRGGGFEIPDLIRTKINLLPDGIQEVRVVEIVGLDLQADGGTHVANTREVGHLRVVDYKSKGAINKRLVVALDR
jgi:misacylated tRNA(Ala) deacylase